MTILEIILLIIIYIFLAIYSYKPFNKISKNGWSNHPKTQAILFPIMWIVALGVAIIEGFKYIFNNKWTS